MASRDDILGALRRALTPPAPALAALVMVAAAGLAWTFLLCSNQDTPVAYLSYAVSAYALVAVCASVATARPLERLRAALPANPLVDRIVSDADFRARLSFSASSVLRVV